MANDKKIEYDKIFYAPVDKTDDTMLSNKFISETKLIKPILFHVGSDEITTTVIAEDTNNERKDFTISIATDKSV
ncbi:MAG: hypothetical protein WCP92_08945 [bacterium]